MTDEAREADVISALIDAYYAGDKNTFGLSATTPEWLREMSRALSEMS